jgi:hypothetical protein
MLDIANIAITWKRGNGKVTQNGRSSVAIVGRTTEMKSKLRIAIVIVLVLAAFTGCELYQAINVTWTTTVAPTVGNITRVSYTVTNLGKIDLTGVNLEIGVDMAGFGTYVYPTWTPDFSLDRNQTKYGYVDIYTVTQPYAAAVLSVDMDNPSG